MITIASVESESPAFRAGIRSGDTLVDLNGKTPTDILDYYYLADDAQLRCRFTSGVDSSVREVRIHKNFGEPLGMQFADVVFDGVRNCMNRCRFCFVDQMPKGLRKTLYVKDDDYRLSMLWGNFITLTNVDQSHIDRIVDQRISPLYVSLHATDPHVYMDLVRPNGKASEPLALLEALIEAELEVHIQIVLCPGINDGEVLGETLHALTEGRYKKVRSVGVVPAGVTRYGSDESLVRPIRADEAEQVIGQVESLAAYEKVFLADEFYLLACRNLPAESDYHGFPQLENGIGIARTFIDGFRAKLEHVKPYGPVVPIRVVTGELVAPVVQTLMGEFMARTGALIEVSVVHNQFFGGNVSVAPLLTGQDIGNALEGANGRVLLPENVFNDDGLTLDGYRIENIADTNRLELIAAPVEGSDLIEFLTRCTAA